MGIMVYIRIMIKKAEFINMVNKIRNDKIIRNLIYLMTAVYVLMTGPIIENDSGSFIHLSMISSPGYPVFLYFFKKIFITYFQEVVIIVQLIISFFSVYFSLFSYLRSTA